MLGGETLQAEIFVVSGAGSQRVQSGERYRVPMCTAVRTYVCPVRVLLL